MPSLLRELGRSVSSLDSKTVRTIGALLRPGRLTSEYLAGRRQPYVAPPKLYLLCAAIFFLAAPAAGFSLDGLLSGVLAPLEPQISSLRDARDMDPGLFAARFDLRFQTIYTAALSLSVLGGALMLGLLFRGQRRPMGAHMIFMLHYVSFLYLINAGAGILTVQTRQGPALTLVITAVALFTYLAMGLHRVYRERPVPTLLKTAAMITFGVVLDSFVTLGAMLLTLGTI